MDIADPKREEARMLMQLPKFTKFSTLHEPEPDTAFLIDIEEPKCTKFNTLMLDPKRVQLKMDTLLPHEAKERVERVEPNCEKFRILMPPPYFW
jgi:hypothetical protein